MAISKEKTLDNGAIGDYWKIAQIIINRIDMHIHVNLSLFSDKAHADQGLRLGCDKDFIFAISRDDLKADIIALAYGKIKIMKDADLVDGEDV